jgi:hypothetical protein
MMSGKEESAIGRYMSSFPKAQRKLLGVKWILDSQLEDQQVSKGWE